MSLPKDQTKSSPGRPYWLLITGVTFKGKYPKKYQAYSSPPCLPDYCLRKGKQQSQAQERTGLFFRYGIALHYRLWHTPLDIYSSPSPASPACNSPDCSNSFTLLATAFCKSAINLPLPFKAALAFSRPTPSFSSL